MRLDARYGTAITLLDQIMAGRPAEQVLTAWARANRYAGSKDRAAVRDIVFSGLRGLKTCQARAGGQGGRAVVLGLLLAEGQDPYDVFTGLTYAPEKLSIAEQEAIQSQTANADPVYDVPDWSVPHFQSSLGSEFDAAMLALKERAPVDLRVNLATTTVEQARSALLRDNIDTEPTGIASAGLRVLTGARGVARSSAYLSGQVELQDAGSQAVVEALPLQGVKTALDYCAGGGGKSLALASVSRGELQITAYDAAPDRLKNLAERAKRARASVAISKTDPAKSWKTFDLVLLDVPCSGSGAWRRNPDGKWKFQPENLIEIVQTQAEILNKSQHLVANSGCLAYVTCSLLTQENEDQITDFLKVHPEWKLDRQTRIPLGEHSDGFFLALMSKK